MSWFRLCASTTYQESIFDFPELGSYDIFTNWLAPLVYFVFQAEVQMNEILTLVENTTMQNKSKIGKLPSLLIESLTLFMTAPTDVSFLPTSTLLVFFCILSSCQDVYARDLLIVAACNAKQSDVLNRHAFNLAIFNKMRTQLLQQLISCTDLGN